MPYLVESSNIVPIVILILVVMKIFSNLLNKKNMLMEQNMKQFSLNIINNLVNTFWAIGTMLLRLVWNLDNPMDCINS